MKKPRHRRIKVRFAKRIRSILKNIGSAWGRFRSRPAESQRLICAAVIGGLALVLFVIALVIGISSCGKHPAPSQDASSVRETQLYSDPVSVSEPEADQAENNEQSDENPDQTGENSQEQEEDLNQTGEESQEQEDDPDNSGQDQSDQEAQTAVLKKHDQSPEVLELQKRLIQLGYFEIDEPTDYFGNSTEYALKLFQRQHDLEMDGVAGEMTLAILFSDEAQKYTLQEGMEGRDVKMLQEQLVDLGYLSSNDVDHVYGEVTRDAIMAFQKRNKLTADGKAGEKTLALLYSDEAKMSEEMAAKVKAEEEEAARKAKEAEAKAKAEEAKAKKEASAEAAKARQKKKEAEAKAARENRINKFIRAAQSKIGCEYVLGSRGPNTFDCSGFVWYCLKQAGVSTTRLNAAGFSRKSGWKEIKSISKLQKGDILFFKSDDSKAVSHTGIYIGSGMMIDASSGNGKVVKRALSAYWKRNFVNARRPW